MYKQIIAVRKDLKLGKGKIAAQAAHASLQAYRKAPSAVQRAWEEEGSKKVVVAVEGKGELFRVYREAGRLPRALIRDAGLTQVRNGEATAVGIGPAREDVIDRITGELKLL